MEENDKPFACTFNGCTMRFTNEDHLTVHKKKHDMVLNLGTGQKSNVFVADQTPTPTRFIRNCEEVGLFQDLQNVNPFEETFRKAVEAYRSGNTQLGVDSLHIPSGTDDTLHTPHVFPHIIEDQSSMNLISSTSVITETMKRKSPTRQELDRLLRPTITTGNDDVCSPSRPNGGNGVKVVRQEADTSQQRTPGPIFKSEPSSDSSSTVQLLLRMPDGKLVQVSGVAVDQPQPIPTLQVSQGAASPGAVVLEALPVTTSAQSITSSSVSVTSSSSTVVTNSKMSLAKQKLKQQLIKANRGLAAVQESTPKQAVPNGWNGRSDGSETTSPPSHPRRSSSADDTDEKRQKFLERNRAAAMRCRKKRKTWIQQLEQRAEDLQRTNQQLQAEVAALRAEVAQLKTLLLAHKDCPVTHALSQGVSVGVAPNSVQQSQQIINVTLPLMTAQNTITPAQQQAPQTVVLQNLPKQRIVVLKKPNTPKRHLSNNETLVLNKKQCVDNVAVQSVSSPLPAIPQTILIASAGTAENTTTMKHEQNIVHNISVTNTNTNTTLVSGTNVMVPNVVVTSHASNMSTTQPIVESNPLVSISLIEENSGNYQNILLPRLNVQSEHQIGSLQDSNDSGTNGITHVIKVNPNVTRSQPESALHAKAAEDINVETGNDSDVEFIGEIPIDNSKD